MRQTPLFREEKKIKRGREEKGGRRSPPLIFSIRSEDSEAVSEVLGVYDAAHVRSLGRHYIASEQQDAEAAVWAFQKATAIAQLEADEKGKGLDDLPELRTRVLEHWSRKLLSDRDYAQSKGFGFWTIKNMITQLGTPFASGKRSVGPGIAKPSPRMSSQEYADNWGNVLENIRKNKAYGDIGG